MIDEGLYWRIHNLKMKIKRLQMVYDEEMKKYDERIASGEKVQRGWPEHPGAEAVPWEGQAEAQNAE